MYCLHFDYCRYKLHVQVYQRKVLLYRTLCTDLGPTICVWIAMRTNYYVPLAAVILDITHELGSTGFRHCICFSVREYY